LVRTSGISHPAFSRSISLHSPARSSPGRTAVRAKRRSPCWVDGVPRRRRSCRGEHGVRLCGRKRVTPAPHPQPKLGATPNLSALLRALRGFRFFRTPVWGVRGARGRSRTDTLLRAADFPTTSAFAAPGALPGSWSGARLHHGLFGFRCPPSALYTFPRAKRGLGSASARARTPGPSPSLTGFTSRISPRGLKSLSESAASTNSATRATVL
jgi:hypothetical protein